GGIGRPVRRHRGHRSRNHGGGVHFAIGATDVLDRGAEHTGLVCEARRDVEGSAGWALVRETEELVAQAWVLPQPRSLAVAVPVGVVDAQRLHGAGSTRVGHLLDEPIATQPGSGGGIPVLPADRTRDGWTAKRRRARGSRVELN